MVNMKNVTNKLKAELLGNEQKRKNLWEYFPKQKGQEILSNKTIETLRLFNSC